VECARVDYQRAAVSRKPSSDARTVPAVEHLGTDSGVDCNDSGRIDTLIDQEGPQFLCISDNEICQSWHDVIENLGQAGRQRSRTNEVKGGQFTNHRVDGIVNYRHSSQLADQAANKRSFIVVSVNHFDVVLSDNSKQLRHHQRIEAESLVTWSHTYCSI